MKFLLITLILSLVAGSLAGTSTGYFNDKDHPGKCVYGGKVFSPGEQYQPKGQCMKFMCGQNGFGQILECGLQVAGPPCKLGDIMKPNSLYPDCCAREIICPKKRMIVEDIIAKQPVHY